MKIKSRINGLTKVFVEPHSSARDTLFLWFILLLGLILRFYHLGFQSLWLDELFTMNECNPVVSWGDTLDMVLAVENKSPLYFFIEKLFLIIFGFNDYASRILSAVAGVLSVYAMYLLGKQLKNTRLGLISALITSINYFDIVHSQDARGYALLFLFTVLSLLYFIRNFNTPSIRNSIWYGIHTVLMLHFHHFAFLVLLAQMVLGLFFILRNKAERGRLFGNFGISAGIVLLGFGPMFAELQKASTISTNWVKEPSSDFYITYFYDFFGNSVLLNPILVVVLFFFIFKVISAFLEEGTKAIGSEGIRYAGILFSISLLIMFLLPFLYSIFVVPILVQRYMIVALPYVVLIIAMGIEEMSDTFKLAALILFVYVSIMDLFIFKDYYYQPSKTQFRELAEVVKTRSDELYPVINELTPGPHAYYMEKFGVSNQILRGKKEKLVDSLKRVAKSDSTFKGFWIIGAHQDPMLSSAKMAELDSVFYKAYTRYLFDAWAHLYLPRWELNKYEIKLDRQQFTRFNTDERDTLISIWRGDRTSKLIPLKRGRYSAILHAYGIKVKNEFPQIQMYVDNVLVADYFLSDRPVYSRKYEFTVNNERDVVFRLKLVNDLMYKGADRNAHILCIYIRHLSKDL